jgi:hypothetical protein
MKRKRKTKKYISMKEMLKKILEEDGIVTTESFARNCGCSYGVAQVWLRNFEKDGLIVVLVRMKWVSKIYKATERMCLRHPQEISGFRVSCELAEGNVNAREPTSR